MADNSYAMSTLIERIDERLRELDISERRAQQLAGWTRDSTSAAILDQLEQYDEADRQAMLRILKGGGFRDTG
jgi:hypothetical protein